MALQRNAHRDAHRLVGKLIRFVGGCVVGMLIVFSLNATDRREYQHGVEFVSTGDSSRWLIWSSSAGDPPRGKNTVVLADGSTCEYFTHDVYYSRIKSTSPELDAVPLISLPEAQEPVSAATTADGSILVTFEDGSDSDVTGVCWGVIQQRFVLYDSAFHAKTRLLTVSQSGGHSGHAAATDSQFVIVYSEGWVDGGGDNDIGTGKAIYLDVVNEQGMLQRHRPIVKDLRSRDWWPLIAASNRHVFFLWQRYVKNSRRAILMYAVYDPAKDHFLKPPTELQTEVYYYHYDVQYLSSVNRFLVSGNELGYMARETSRGGMPLLTQKGFVYLLDEQGDIVDQWSANHICEACSGYHTHAFVRESQPAIYANEENVQVIYPVKPKGVLWFSLTADSIKLQKYVADDYYWHSLGTDGIFLDQRTAYFATLSPLGLQTRTINID